MSTNNVTDQTEQQTAEQSAEQFAVAKTAEINNRFERIISHYDNMREAFGFSLNSHGAIRAIEDWGNGVVREEYACGYASAMLRELHDRSLTDCIGVLEHEMKRLNARFRNWTLPTWSGFFRNDVEMQEHEALAKMLDETEACLEQARSWAVEYDQRLSNEHTTAAASQSTPEP